MKFELIRYKDLNRTSFDESRTWAQYYEPADIETLSELGFDKTEVSAAIAKVGWSDDYWFAVPDETKIGSFMFEHRKASFTTKSGKKLNGYVVNSGHCICLFGTTEEWSININLLDLLDEEVDDLKADVGLSERDTVLPLEVSIPFMDAEFTFGENS